jgi:N-acetylglucosamine-6-sulfatase
MRRRITLLLPPLTAALALALLARGLDEGSALGLGHETLRRLGLAYFALLAGAPLLLHPLAFRAGAAFGERIVAALLPAALWWGSEVALRLASHSLAEAVWLSLSPFVTALFQLLALEIGLAELVARTIERARRGGAWLRARDGLVLLGLLLVVGNPLVSAVWFLPFSIGFHHLFQEGLLPEPSERPGPLPAGTVAPAATSLPNLVVIYSDDHRYDLTGYAGHPFVETPSLDRLAAEGVVFENAFVTSSLCSPSRASLLTGMDVRRHGVVNNFTPWSDQNRTFFEYLAQRGYRSAFVGKWHMPGHLPELRGVELFVTFTDLGGQGSYENGPLVVNGTPEASRKRYMAEELTDRALDFIEEVGDAPFALLISHKNVHAPFTPDLPEQGRYAEAPVTLPRGAHPWSHWTNAQYVHLTPPPLDDALRRYAEAVTSMDRQIGRVLDALDARGLSDHTFVFYTSDNGYLWGEHGLTDKRWAYEESIRVPFLLRPPKGMRGAGERTPRLVLSLDIAPTLLDAAGIPTPAGMQGRSVLPLLEGGAAPWRDAFAYSYWFEPPYPTPTQRALRSERWKYVEYEDRPPELFDLHADPQELRNLADQADPELLAALRRRLDALAEDPRATPQDAVLAAPRGG